MRKGRHLLVFRAGLFALFLTGLIGVNNVVEAQSQSGEKIQLPTTTEVKPKAEYGDPVAQYQLGMIYLTGFEGSSFNGNRDPEQALEWFRKSADQNYVPAELILGEIYLQGYGGLTPDGTNQHVDPARAATWFQKAADQNDPQGQFELGQLYLRGLGVNADGPKALRLFLLAADQKFLPAYSQLAWMYGKGIGVKADISQEVAYVRKAADLGDSEACIGMSDFYAEGHGVQKDSTQVEFWLVRAVQAGSVRAVNQLYEMSEAGQISDTDMKTVAESEKRRAEKGDLTSAFHLGFLYAKGFGVPKNIEEAVKWLEIGGAASWNKGVLADLYAEGKLIPRNDKRALEIYEETGNSGALARMYSEGRGTPQDDAKAAEQFHNAAVANHSDAQIAYGEYLLAGRGVPKDPIGAMDWFRRGAQRRLGEALLNIGIDYVTDRGVPRDLRMQNYWYRKAAAYDMDVAEMNLARDLLTGQGIQKDAIEACAWLTIANPQLNSAGGELAQITENASGEMLEKIKNRVEALRNIRQSSGGYYEDSNPYSGAAPDIPTLQKQAASGNPLAEMRLAFAFEKGQGVLEDADAAIQMYKHLQKAGPMELHAWLGIALANGDGFPQDYKLARQRLEEAAEEGSIPAREALARLDIEGKGSNPSLMNAYMWLTLAGGDPKAAQELSDLATKLKPEEIKQAQSLAADWRSKHTTIHP
jgi:uncharacterized protein